MVPRRGGLDGVEVENPSGSMVFTAPDRYRRRSQRPGGGAAGGRGGEQVESRAESGRPWHALGVEDVVAALDATPAGLSSAEAARRLAEHGPNRLPKAARRGPLRRLAAQFNNLLIHILLASAAISFLLDHAVDAAVILGVVLVNALIGFVQEGRAEQALEAIQGMIDPKASVLRDGRRATVPADQVVPGDIVLLEAGDRVPGDLRLLRARGLGVDEAILTGESVAAQKMPDPVPEAAALGDRRSMAYSGTFVNAGQATGVAVATGAATELGRISALLGAVETLKTPLLRQMDGFGRQLTWVVLGVCAVTFLFAHLVRRYSLDEAFMVVVGLAVAAIPEGLPAVMTITLAIGVRRMAARNAIIRRLPAVETLGSVSVICSDKTGTLTRNEMVARTVVTARSAWEVAGTGYAPAGGFSVGGEARDPTGDAGLMDLLRCAVLCNDADIREGQAGWLVDGDPMEGALVALGGKAGLEAGALRRQAARRDEIPFDAQHRFMATLHEDEDGGFIVVKGAPERVVEMCSRQREGAAEAPLEPERWRRAAEQLAGQGLRVLGFAVKPAGRHQRSLDFADVERDAILLGFVGFMDPPREEAVEAVAECAAAGIRVVMITGDHAATAREIARQLGLAERPTVLSGTDLEPLGDAALLAAAREADVFARTTPSHKLRLVQALQQDGSTVAMTGDGVNDAPALKRADVGVAMGRKGTEAAKEVADMVLADDNFASIVAAVREGRTVYDNIVKVIGWTLPTNGGEALTILAALALGLALPVTPVQILWINMVTAVALGLTLAFEPTEPGAMRRPPRRPDQALVPGELAWRIALVSLLVVAGAFGMFFWAEARGLPIEAARTLVVNTIVVMEIFYLFSVRYVHGTSLTWRGAIGTPAVLIGVGIVAVAQLLFTYLPIMQTVFQTRAVGPLEGMAVIGAGVALLLIVEGEKQFRERLRRARRTSGS
jgi:magnesium-transporting ATPase (P-type)